MAKSIRSKWKRKCRAVKRIRYGEKELERLKKTLTNDPNRNLKDEKDTVMTDIEQVANVKTAKQIKEKVQDDPMNDDVKKDFNPRTLRNKDGAYPVWVHPRKIKSTKKNKKKNKKNVKRNKQLV